MQWNVVALNVPIVQRTCIPLVCYILIYIKSFLYAIYKISMISCSYFQRCLYNTVWCYCYFSVTLLLSSESCILWDVSYWLRHIWLLFHQVDGCIVFKGWIVTETSSEISTLIFLKFYILLSSQNKLVLLCNNNKYSRDRVPSNCFPNLWIEIYQKYPLEIKWVRLIQNLIKYGASYTLALLTEGLKPWDKQVELDIYKNITFLFSAGGLVVYLSFSNIEICFSSLWTVFCTSSIIKSNYKRNNGLGNSIIASEPCLTLRSDK